MNENWPEIVETLIPYFETNSVEGDYQREIENCLKFLGVTFARGDSRLVKRFR